MSRASPEIFTDSGFRNGRAALQGTPSHRMVVDRGICSGIGIAANSVDEHGFVLHAVFVLPVEISRGIAFEILLISLFVAGHLGCCPRLPNFQGQAEFGTGVSDGHHVNEDSRLERGSTSLVVTASLDFGMGVVLAGLVSGRDGVASESNDRIGRRRRFVEMAA